MNGIPECQVTSALDYLEQVNQVRRDFSSMWFRGQPNRGRATDPEWKLEARIDRRNQAGAQHDERFLAQAFKNRAPSRYTPCPTGKDFPSWLFLMQHYGLPTRLLDWTANPLVALFFAVHDRRRHPRLHATEPLSDDGGSRTTDLEDTVVWALDPIAMNGFELMNRRAQFAVRQIAESVSEFNFAKQVNEIGWLDPWMDPALSLFRQPFLESDSPSDSRAANTTGAILAIKPVELDKRVMHQSSRFTLHGRPIPLDSHPLRSTILKRFVIPGAIRPDIELELQALEMCRARLFPDLEGLAEDLGRFGVDIDR